MSRGEKLMFIACDESGESITIDEAYAIKDKQEDTKFFCPHPQCGKELILKGRGTKVTPHFAHKRGCADTWKYGEMTEWHKAWQNRFPKEYREVYLELNGESHRADILIEDAKTVIEFQHSSISTKDFEARNAFYKACGYLLIWVFDATGMTKYDDMEWLCWKREKVIFKNIQTKPDVIFLQNYVPDVNSERLLWTQKPPVKYLLNDLDPYNIVAEFMPENLLKQYNIITDDQVPSLTDLQKDYLDIKKDYLEKERQRKLRCQIIRQRRSQHFIDFLNRSKK